MSRVHMRHCWFAIFSGSIALLCVQSGWGGVADAYLSAYLEMFPTRATQAGNHAFDSRLEDFSTEKLARWVEVNQAERDRLTKLISAPDLPFDDRLDAEALLAQVERELHEQIVLRRPQRDPLYWSEVIANAAVFLLVRDDLPLTGTTTAGSRARRSVAGVRSSVQCNLRAREGRRGCAGTLQDRGGTVARDRDVLPGGICASSR